MQHVEPKAKATTVFFDPFAQKRRRPGAPSYAPYFPSPPDALRPTPLVVEPVRTVDIERD